EEVLAVWCEIVVTRSNRHQNCSRPRPTRGLSDDLEGWLVHVIDDAELGRRACQIVQAPFIPGPHGIPPGPNLYLLACCGKRLHKEVQPFTERGAHFICDPLAIRGERSIQQTNRDHIVESCRFPLALGINPEGAACTI